MAGTVISGFSWQFGDNRTHFVVDFYTLRTDENGNGYSMQ